MSYKNSSVKRDFYSLVKSGNNHKRDGIVGNCPLYLASMVSQIARRVKPAVTKNLELLGFEEYFNLATFCIIFI